MSKRAEEKAVEYQIKTHGPNVMGGASMLSEEEYMRFNMNLDFKNGYELAEKDLGWHSVEESLPEEAEYVTDNGCHQKWSKSVFVITTGNSVMLCWTKDGEFFCDKDFHFPVKVKYWMPMPRIPEEK